MTPRERIVIQTRKLLGVRFMHQGRDGAQGLDCLGLLLVAAERAGITLSGKSPMALDRRDYRTRPDVDALRARLEEFLVPVPLNAMQPGDIVLLKIDGSPQHLALISDYPVAGAFGMIHAYAPARKVVEHRYDETWRAATVGVFGVKQICN